LIPACACAVEALYVEEKKKSSVFAGVMRTVSELPAWACASLAIFEVTYPARVEGITATVAPLPPVSVPALTSAWVAISTFPATVSEALGVEPEAVSAHAPPSYFWRVPEVVL